VAILYEDQRITYRQLQASVNRLGSALRTLGLEEEDRVLLRAPSIPPALVANFAVIRIEGLGTTEMMYVFVSSAVTRRVKPGAIGPAVPGYELRVLGEDGAPVGGTSRSPRSSRTGAAPPRDASSWRSSSSRRCWLTSASRRAARRPSAAGRAQPAAHHVDPPAGADLEGCHVREPIARVEGPGFRAAE
jgi:hypothetical protein